MLTQTDFERHSSGQMIVKYTLTNRLGMAVSILNLGAIIQSITLPTKGKNLDLVLGFDSVVEYEQDQSHFGAVAGRYANRIKNGKFSLKGQAYQVSTNLAGHCLHGGKFGFNRYIWQLDSQQHGDQPSITLSMTSPDGDQGFPGQLTTKVRYTLSQDNQLNIEYFASSDKTTIFNPTQHSYFNLNGHEHGSVAKHSLQLMASHYTPIDKTGIPTGKIASVIGTPFDFTQPRTIEQALATTHSQLTIGNGLDHNLCLDGYSNASHQGVYAGQVSSADSGLSMQIYTSMPGVQVFTANHIAGTKGKGGTTYQAHQGLCIETQFYPDAPNQKNFDCPILEAGDEFYSITQYKFNQTL